MISGTSRWVRAAVQALGVGFLLGFLILGCEGQHAGAPGPDGSSAATTETAAGQAEPGPTQTTAAKPATAEARLNQPFTEATRAEPPADWQRPPDVTMTGKSVGKLYTEVVSQWGNIPFEVHGKRIFYSVILDTELGQVEIALLPEVAPNHVRNFLALTKAGYYDGLVFERTVHEKSEGQPDLELIEAGCPIGTGELGYGSIGYWLKPEFSDEQHVEGTVGACHGEDPETAACKFYITLGKAPFLDKNFTVFGRVTHGLDVCRRIFALPVRNDPEYPEGDRPEKPVVIRKAVIVTHEVEKQGSAPDNK